MLKKFFIFCIISFIVFVSCQKNKEIRIDKPGDALVSMTIEKSFGVESNQVIKVMFRNSTGELSELADGVVKFNNVPLNWTNSNKAYYLDAGYILNDNSLNKFEITFPNGDIVESEIMTPLFFENVEIPSHININQNTEITWEGGNPQDEIVFILWIRMSTNESWQSIKNIKTPDDGSYVIPSSTFNINLEHWQYAIELARGIQGEADPLFLDGSEIYSLFVYGRYDGILGSD